MIHSLKYLRSPTLKCKEIGIRKSKFVTKTQFLLQKFHTNFANFENFAKMNENFCLCLNFCWLNEIFAKKIDIRNMPKGFFQLRS